jgi:hypothetical protein
MSAKKTAIMASFIFLIAIASANFASAAIEWTPLVRIPGLPSTGTVNLSMYLIGLYNFLLSIVGIVAVIMLIIGGMRYITAVGNPTAISSAKEIILNAIVGLVLALLSWVFISTINPDALYIKQPGSAGFSDPATGVHDLATLPVSTSPSPCIANGSPVDDGSFNFNSPPYNGKCQCVDKTLVPISGATCQETCEGDHCLVAIMKALATADLPYERWGDYARVYNTPEAPLVIPDGSWIGWNGLNYSILYPTFPGLTPPVNYCFDGLPSPATSNGACDLGTEGGSGNARGTGNVLYNSFLGKSNCVNITDPASIQCKFPFMIQDSSGISSETNLYVRILKP